MILYTSGMGLEKEDLRFSNRFELSLTTSLFLSPSLRSSRGDHSRDMISSSHGNGRRGDHASLRGNFKTEEYLLETTETEYYCGC